MRRTVLQFCLLGFFCALLSARVWALPYDEMQPPVVDATLKKEIVPPQKELTIDEYIIALAKASDVNFIADASKIKADARVKPFPAGEMARSNQWGPKLYLVLLDFTQEHRLSQLRYDDKSFLFWSEPDTTDLLQLLLAHDSTLQRKHLSSPEQTFSLLSDYAKSIQRWGGQAQQFYFNAKLAELPAAAQSSITSMARRSILMKGMNPTAWFTDDLWKTARLRLEPGTVLDDKAVPYEGLHVYGQDEKGAVLSSWIGGLRVP
ncbi:MAG TPA: hypothetical protein VF600_01695 [Abditibacteriaceae bacterium]|jgi:hypothetical protein